MAYADLAGLIQRFGEGMLVDLTDRGDPPTDAVVTSVVDAAIADTDALIDGYLQGRYQLPLQATPELIQALSETIAIYKLHIHVAGEKITDDYKDALKALKDISTGVVRIPAAGIEPATGGGNGVKAKDRPRDLTPENMTGFI